MLKSYVWGDPRGTKPIIDRNHNRSGRIGQKIATDLKASPSLLPNNSIERLEVDRDL